MNETIELRPSQPDRLASYMPDPSAEQQEQTGFSFNIADLRAMLWRQRKLILIVVGGALFLGLALSLLVTPLFEATARVRVDNENVKIIAGQDVDPTVSLNDTNRYLNTQALVLQSRAMALHVVDDLGLARDGSFLTHMRVHAPDSSLSPSSLQVARRETAAGVLMSNLKVTVPLDSRILTLSFTSPDGQVAADVINSYARNFVANNVRSGLDSNAYARKILSDQIDSLRAQLEAQEHKAIDYARQNNLIDASDAGGGGASDTKSNSAGSGNSQSITTANLVRLNQAYMEAVSNRIMAEQRWKAAASTAPMQTAEVQQNPEVSGLISQRALVAAQYAQLSARYAADFPATRQVKAQLDSIDAQINRSVTNVRKALQYQYEVAAKQEASLSAERDKLSSTTLEEQSRRVQLNLIARDVDSLRNQLNDLMERYNQVSSASDIVRNNVSLMDAALAPNRPVSPNFPKNMAIALALGLALALVLALAREAVDDTLRSPDDVETKLQLALLGTTPVATGEDIRHVSTDAKSALTEAYYSIRVSLDHATSTGAPETLQVTSSQPAEGKSTTATALARDYARMGKRVLLIDADLRRPTLHRLFNVERQYGFIDVLLGLREIGQCAVPSGTDNLDLLPLGQVPPNPVEILSSNVISDFIQRYRSTYDLMIFDTSPIMGLADAPLISRKVQAVVLIVEAGRAHNGQAKAAVRRLRDAGAKIAGAVLTKFDHRQAGYSYDYHYKYYHYEGSTEG